jgi:hypothetical protein
VVVRALEAVGIVLVVRNAVVVVAAIQGQYEIWFESVAKFSLHNVAVVHPVRLSVLLHKRLSGIQRLS